MIGRTLSHYRIVEKLGEGGMGVMSIAPPSTGAAASDTSIHNYARRFA